MQIKSKTDTSYFVSITKTGSIHGLIDPKYLDCEEAELWKSSAGAEENEANATNDYSEVDDNEGTYLLRPISPPRNNATPKPAIGLFSCSDSSLAITGCGIVDNKSLELDRFRKVDMLNMYKIPSYNDIFESYYKDMMSNFSQKSPPFPRENIPLFDPRTIPEITVPRHFNMPRW